jgi:lysine decarboxylase
MGVSEVSPPSPETYLADRQDQAPLADAADAFLAAPGTPFTTPGHKRNAKLVDPTLAVDLPLVSGADDSRMGARLLERAEGLAAELWGAEYCRFSVSGSTHGNQALALAVGEPGQPVIAARTLHKSLFGGLVLSGAWPIWVTPTVDASTGLPLAVPAVAVADALAAHPAARAVFLTEPSYVGVVSDVREVGMVASAAGIPLVVDQAWGAHFGFHPLLPDNCIRLGASGVVTSLHKTLTGFSQAAVVLASAQRLDLGRLEAGFETLNTTSPSAAILATIDRCRRLMATRGEELLSRTIELVADARRRVSEIPGVLVVGNELVARHPEVHRVDSTKLVISLAATGADGFAVEADLNADGVRVEMTDRDTLVPLVTIGDDERSVRRLVESLRHSIAKRRGKPRKVSASIAWRLEPEVVMTPREAYFAPRQRVSASAAVGRISAETAAPYPPGIPAIAPGELVTRDVIEHLQAEVRAGSRVAYCSDPSLETLLVVSGRNEGRSQMPR